MGRPIEGAKPKVLVVDDEPRMRSLLALHLRQSFDVETVASGEEALARIAHESFDAVLLDILMPGMGGKEVCRRIRAHHSVPVLMLTALADVEEKLEAFEAGADDYVTKPFDPRELVARVEALIRRAQGGSGRIVFPGLVIDRTARTVDVEGQRIALTPKEYELLVYLAAAPGRAFSREELLHAVWRDVAYAQTRTVDSHIKTLREKLGREGVGRCLVTVWGVGYKFEPDVD